MRTVGTFFLLIILTGFAACGNDPVSSKAYRYEHVATLASDYVEMLSTADFNESGMQFLLLDIRSRADRLKDRGEDALAEYFIAEIERQLSSADPSLAESLFGQPTAHSVFIDK